MNRKKWLLRKESKTYVYVYLYILALIVHNGLHGLIGFPYLCSVEFMRRHDARDIFVYPPLDIHTTTRSDKVVPHRDMTSQPCLF